MSDAGNKARERAKRIIRELQQKTEANGCTEHEAMAAAAQIGELLEKYDLEIDEIGVREDAAKCEKNRVFAADPYAGAILAGIRDFCSLIYYRDNSNHTAYVLFGTPHDLEIALYLYEMLSEAIERDWTDYMNRYGYSMKKRISFRAGFADRVYSRFKQMKADRDARNRVTGTALVVLKDQLVRQEFGKLGIHLVKGSGFTIADGSAYRQGQAAGDRANLNNPLGNPGGSSPSLR